MVSIQRLPVTLSHPQSKPQPNKSGTAEIAQPSVVAKAVAQSVRDPDVIQHAHARIQYDQPEGKHREALESYMGVMHQQRRDELSALVGVDLYV
ncbi:hypothetical protein [Photobacterium nomapromontoriensis]|uniref:hypothetical protein n=1 Tax=Photobacterium nomapromontoriensis TaxID=2910237 RepID=UPI003D09B203